MQRMDDIEMERSPIINKITEIKKNQKIQTSQTDRSSEKRKLEEFADDFHVHPTDQKNVFILKRL